MRELREIQEAIAAHEEFRAWFLDQNEPIDPEDLNDYDPEYVVEVDGQHYHAQDVIDAWAEWKGLRA